MSHATFNVNQLGTYLFSTTPISRQYCTVFKQFGYRILLVAKIGIFLQGKLMSMNRSLLLLEFKNELSLKY